MVPGLQDTQKVHYRYEIFFYRSAMPCMLAEAVKASSLPITSYSPIARSLLVYMDDTTRDRMRKKFDICYVIAKEGMPFRKYPILHALEERHGVDLGFAYKTNEAAKTFTISQRVNAKAFSTLFLPKAFIVF